MDTGGGGCIVEKWNEFYNIIACKKDSRMPNLPKHCLSVDARSHRNVNTAEVTMQGIWCGVGLNVIRPHWQELAARRAAGEAFKSSKLGFKNNILSCWMSLSADII